MNPTEVLAALLVIERRVPDRHVTVDEAMAVSWHQDLERFPAVVGMRAAAAWGQMHFPSTLEFVQACQAEARHLIAEEQAAHAAGEALQDCPNGCECGVMILTAGSIDTVRPCSWCRPTQYAIWLHRTAPGHDEDSCPDCIGIRKRQTPSWAVTAPKSRDSDREF